MRRPHPADVVSLYITRRGGSNSGGRHRGRAGHRALPVTDLPKPTQVTSVTVAGQTAVIKFIGIPWNLVGVLLINYQVPSGLVPSMQPVIVTIGGVSSPVAFLHNYEVNQISGLFREAEST